ncbi:MAG: methionine--tRNA ligase [Myxococcota bacterium]
MSAKTFYITTPIYYVNGNPHIGHAYTTTAADAIARYRRLEGRSVFFLTGTDEHGQKVLEAADKRGMTPKAHCDDMVPRWKSMMADLQIEYDRFLRTTDDDHIAVVQSVLSRLYERGCMYLDSYTGWYSTAAERFWTEKDLIDGKCPDSGQPVVEITEENWFFKMSAYGDQLRAHILENPGFIQPESRRNEVLGFLDKGLGDLCISRPKSRMGWGIEIPFAKDYVTYVWFDALLNYLTGTGYPVDGADGEWQHTWPPDFQLLGKDILTTHAVYWITMLLALDVPLPKTLFAHGWWVSGDGEKMSKSLGNTIEVDTLKSEYGLDAVRYFLLREIAFGADARFTYEGFNQRYNDDLANDFGNLAHRGLSMTTNWLGGRIPPLGERTEAEEGLVQAARDAIDGLHTALETLQYHKGLEAVNALVRAANGYIEQTQPWALNKAGNTARLQTVKRHVLEVCHVAAALQLFVMPNKCAELLGKLGVDDATAAFRAVRTASDPLALLVEGTPITLGDPLFPRFRELPASIQAMFASEPEPKKPAKKEKKAKSAPPPPAEIEFTDFQKVQLKVGRVQSAEPHPDADRLLVLKVDVGEAAPRQIVAGIASKFAPADVVGRTVVVVANLKPAMLRGVESQGMLLAAGGNAVVDLVSVGAEPGEVVR